MIAIGLLAKESLVFSTDDHEQGAFWMLLLIPHIVTQDGQSCPHLDHLHLVAWILTTPIKMVPGCWRWSFIPSSEVGALIRLRSLWSKDQNCVCQMVQEWASLFKTSFPPGADFCVICCSGEEAFCRTFDTEVYQSCPENPIYYLWFSSKMGSYYIILLCKGYVISS